MHTLVHRRVQWMRVRPLPGAEALRQPTKNLKGWAGSLVGRLKGFNRSVGTTRVLLSPDTARIRPTRNMRGILRWLCRATHMGAGRAGTPLLSSNRKPLVWPQLFRSQQRSQNRCNRLRRRLKPPVAAARIVKDYLSPVRCGCRCAPAAFCQMFVNRVFSFCLEPE